MSKTEQPVVILKKKVHHGGHHGGAWKVAYADFVTAMMAFFLVMWLVGQSKAVKAAVGGYFRDPAVFESQNGKGVLPGGKSLDVPAPPEPPAADRNAERKRLEDAVSHMRAQLDQVPAFKTLRNHVEFTVTPEGLRIDLIEHDDSTFFNSGSATLRGESEHILGVIAHELGTLDHDVVVEGHTDSRAYASNDRYSNWELSADRANAARRVMERGGLRQTQVSSVRGLADRELRVPSDPLDPRNRRVSIVVKGPLTKSAPAATPAAAKPAASAGQASVPTEQATAAATAH
jgi:chemotaxis protein MotB